MGFDGDVDEDVIIGLIEVDRGQCGNNATYVLYSNGLLEISGTGALWANSQIAWDRTKVVDVIVNEGITVLGIELFKNYRALKTAHIPSTLTTFGESCFYGSSIENVDIAPGISLISPYVFRNCTNLTALTLPNTVTYINNAVIKGCSSLTSFTVLATTPPRLNTHGLGLPSGTTIYVPAASVDAYKTAWSSYADQIQPIPEVIETGSCGTDATYELWSTGLLEISGTGEISDSIYYQNAFQGRTDISSVVIHTGITIIGAQAFYECSNIASVDIPEGVTKIDTNALRGCIRMTSVTIPSTVTNVGYGAFCDWTFQSLLETVTVLAETPPVTLAQSDLFAGCMRLTAIYVPAASVDTYKAASGWSSYASKIQAIPSGD